MHLELELIYPDLEFLWCEIQPEVCNDFVRITTIINHAADKVTSTLRLNLFPTERAGNELPEDMKSNIISKTYKYTTVVWNEE